MKSLLLSVYNWVDERLDVSSVIKFAKKKEVPVHKHSFWYYWGGISLFFFIVQAFTGVLLLVYYRPGAEAYESVREITYQIHFGWLIRSVHSWSANLMLVAIFGHMFSVYFMKAYRKPREFGWFTGIALLLVTMFFGFSGYLLPMDDLAYFATKVGLEIPTVIPTVGPWMADLIRGGKEVSAFTIQRFFALHTVVLPAIFLPLLGFHLWLVQKHGNAIPPSEENKPRHSIPFFPNFLAKDLAMWLISLNLLALLASLFPWDLGPQADSIKPAPPGIHPEWYFMSSFQMLKIFGQVLPGAIGEVLGLFTFTLGLFLWTIIPFFDTKEKAGQWGRRATYFGYFVLVILIITTAWGYVAVSNH